MKHDILNDSTPFACHLFPARAAIVETSREFRFSVS